MKVIKFEEKKSYNYKRKVFVRDLVLKISVGIHAFEKKKKQRVRFNIDILLNQNLIPDNNNLNSIEKFYSKEKYFALIKKQNFTNISYRNLSGGIVSIHSALKV